MHPADRITATYFTATGDQTNRGTHWYELAHHIAGRVICPGDPDAGAGVLAALSPQTGWEQNLANAMLLAAGRRPTRMVSETTRTKAERIALGEDWRTVLRGRKERAFAQCIAVPDDPWTVVVDRHALAVFYGRTPTVSEKAAFARKGGYETVADAYRLAGVQLGVAPLRVQATTWLVWRERGRVVSEVTETLATAG